MHLDSVVNYLKGLCSYTVSILDLDRLISIVTCYFVPLTDFNAHNYRNKDTKYIVTILLLFKFT